jgi:MYXO-CTERM domain-containing protein
MVRRSTLSSVFALALGVSSSALAANFGAAGPIAFAESAPPTGFLPGSSDISIVAPTAAGQYPLVIATHGWSAGRVNQMGWARHLASYGYVVIVPGMPNPLTPDQAVWSGNIRTLATNATDANLFPQVASKVDATKIVYEGFSAGALASTLAAKAKAPTLLVLLDPVDNNNQGAGAIGSVCAPILNFFTQASGCNNNMGWSAYATNGTGPLVRMGIKASTHCDGEDEARALCGSFCGGAAKPANRDTIRKYMVAYLEWKLRGNAEAAALFTTQALAADTALENTAVLDRPACGATNPGTPDAGTTTPDAGTSVQDAGTSPASDAGTTTSGDAGSTSTTDAGVVSGADAGVDEGTAASGCACSTTRVSSASPFALLLALVPLARRRNRKS